MPSLLPYFTDVPAWRFLGTYLKNALLPRSLSGGGASNGLPTCTLV